jgi:hypothetical protein
MTTIQEVVTAELTKDINQFGKLIARNAVGYKMTLYGYIRKVEDDHIIWEHNDDPKQYRMPVIRVESFEPE